MCYWYIFENYGTWLQLLQTLMECTSTLKISPQSIYCSKILLTVIKVSNNNSDPEFLNVHVIGIWIISYAICSTNLKKLFNLTPMIYPSPFCNQPLRVLINKDEYFNLFLSGSISHHDLWKTHYVPWFHNFC